jgi:hypothetical protein
MLAQIYLEMLKNGLPLLYPFKGTEKMDFSQILALIKFQKFSPIFLTEYKRLSFLQQQNNLASQA